MSELLMYSHNGEVVLSLAEEIQVILIGELALKLHQARNEDLSIAIPDGTTVDVAEHAGVIIENGEARFATLSDRNSIVAAYSLQQLRTKAPFDAASLFTAAYDLWRHEIGHADMASGRMLASVNLEIDVTKMAADHIGNGAHVFDTLHQIQAMLLHADALPITSLVQLNDAQHEGTKRDMAAYMLFNAVEKWLSSRLDMARELTTLLLAEPLRSRENLLCAACDRRSEFVLFRPV